MPTSHGFDALADLGPTLKPAVLFTLRSGEVVPLSSDEAEDIARLLGEAANACRDHEAG